MKRSTLVAIGLWILAVGSSRVAAAQSVPAAEPGRLEVSVGALWIGQLALGSNDANETTPTGGNLKIFSTSTDLGSVAGLEARMGVRLLQSLEAEVEGSYGTPQLKVTITGDIENAPDVTATESVQQFTLGAGVMWYLPVHAARARLVPFVSGGVGHLRQVHEERTSLETGLYYYVGGGAKWLLFARPRGFVNAIGLRVDARAIVRTKGVAFDDGGHTSPAIGASAFVRF
jgi:hypothetical protein